MSMYVITHKIFNYYNLPKDYIPLLVGANEKKNKEKFLTDNTGDNISNKNKYYSEETGLYWIWKNSNYNKVGLSHYRRFFAPYSNRKIMFFAIMVKGKVAPASVKYLDTILEKQKIDWIVSQPEHSGKETLWEQFDYIHNINDLKITEEVINELYPDYSKNFDQVIKHNDMASFYNMFYTTKKELNDYCKWLFSVLFEVEKRTNVEKYDGYQQRLYGFLSERLLNVWLDHRNARIKYLPVYEKEKMNRNYVLGLFRK